MDTRSAEAAFRWVMLLYPARFRRAHGLALFELFRDDLRAARLAHGRRGVLTTLAKATVDAVASAPGAWRDQLERRSPSSPRQPGRRSHRRPFQGLSDDLKLAIRRLRRAPGFAALAIATLAVGIGATTTVFSFMNAVLLRPLSADDPDRVVRVIARTGAAGVGAASRRFSYPEFVDYRDRSTAVQDVSGVNLATLIADADGRSDQILGEVVSGRYLRLLGARASHGRLLSEADDRPGAPPAVVISDAFWRQRFGAAAVVGRQLWLNRTAYTVVGVAARSVVGSFVGAPIDAWVPLESSGNALGAGWRTDRARPTLAMLGRLRQGVSRERAQAQLQTLAASLAREHGAAPDARIEVAPGTLVVGEQRRLAVIFVSLLLGLVVLVLVIACANVANLLLARAFGRRRELAVRLAIGASRSSLVRMLAVESVLLSACGGAAALVIASAAGGFFAHIVALPTLTLRLDMHTDVRVVVFAASVALAAGAALGCLGGIHAIRPDLTPALKEESLTSIGGRSSMRLRGALAALQVVISLLLLVGAALFVRSVRGAAAVDLGFDPSGVVALDVDAAGGRAAPASIPFFNRVLQRLHDSPFVESAAVSSRAPLDSSTPIVHVSAERAVAEESGPDAPSASFLVVSAEFFDVVKTPILRGRAFRPSDDGGSLPVVIVNETLAARLWPQTDPVGRRLWLEAAASPSPGVVIGVARDAKYRTLGEERQGHVYLPFAQRPRAGMTLLVRTPAAPPRAIQVAQDALRTVDPAVQGFFARTLRQHVDVSILPVKMAATLTLVVALCALAFAAIGLYSVVSFVVAERTGEIGLRMALGADRNAVLRLVAGAGMRLAVSGLALGIPLALAASRLLRNFLYGVSPVDPIVFASGSIVVLGVTLIASAVPAIRALRLDPLAALRRG